MGKGFLVVNLTSADESLPVVGAGIVVSDDNDNMLYTLQTDASGNSPKVELPAPDKIHTLRPEAEIPYGRYSIRVSANGFHSVTITGIRIFDTSETIQNIAMTPITANETRLVKPIEIHNEAHGLRNPMVARARFLGDVPDINNRVLKDVIIPDHIVVHLGTPSSYASNVRVTFKDYIKNVASNEIYDTWPTAALEANIYCIISFTLNRVFTEWYRSKGYSFDITNSTTVDHYFKHGSAFGGNISRIVDNMFNKYLAIIGHKEPFLAQYCDGNYVKCPGWLSQWGSCYDAQNGMGTKEIIRKYYYIYDLEFRESNLFYGPVESYPGTPLREGSSGSNVLTIQNQLNRIGGSFPIPVINNPNGYFDSSTTAAVKKFQQDFNLTADGIVGKATWYKINQIYVAVKSLAEMNSEGEHMGIGHTPPKTVIREGSRGQYVAQLQFLLNYISIYYDNIPSVIENGVFDLDTENAVKQFQKMMNLNPDGIVGPATWNSLYDTYWGIKGNAPTIPPGPTEPSPNEVPPYPGYLLKVGVRDQNVMLVQTALKRLSEIYPQIPKVTPDGIFGPQTENAVKAFQNLFGLTPDGIVGPATWSKLMQEYFGHLTGGSISYPGSPIKIGQTGENVTMIQRYLNKISTAYPSIAKVSEDGIFGSGTQSAVKAFQNIFGLTPDGIVGPDTWSKLMEVYAKTDSWDTTASKTNTLDTKLSKKNLLIGALALVLLKK